MANGRESEARRREEAFLLLAFTCLGSVYNLAFTIVCSFWLDWSKLVDSMRSVVDVVGRCFILCLSF